MALELRRRVQVYQEHLGTVSSTSWACCIGLHTGVVVVGSRQDDGASTVVGMWSPWPWGSRSGLHLARSCSDTTARLVQRTVRLEAVAPVQVSGQPTPVTPYAILSNRGRRALGWDHWGRLLSPFVGREREMATLQALLAQVEAGHGQVVGVVGEPGLGKSRLVYEFRRSLGGDG